MVAIQEKLSRTSKTLMFSEPFYGLFLIGLNKVYRTDIPTAGVSKNGIGVQLAVNPEFFMSLNDKHQIGLLKHELIHIAFGHLTMRDRFENKKIFNVAADIEINQYINKDYLPEGGLTLESFPELTLKKKSWNKILL